MKKDIKIHIIYGSIILLITFILSYNQYSIYQNTQAKFLSQDNKFTTNIHNLKTKLISKIELTNKTLNNNINYLKENLMQKDIEIKSLTSEITTVKTESSTKIDELQNKIINLQGEYKDFSDVIKNSIPSVVSIKTNLGSGSGFIYNEDNGYIITNYHVIAGILNGHITTSNGKNHPFQIIGINSKADLAVVRINDSNIKELKLSSKSQIGEKVIAVGNPGGLDFSVTQGIISSTERIDSDRNIYLQIDAPINPGNSGGPLINSNGEVIGINTLKISEFEGIGFAIRADYAKEVVDDIIRNFEKN